MKSIRILSLPKSMFHRGIEPAAPRIGPAPGNSTDDPMVLMTGPPSCEKCDPTESPVSDALAQLQPVVPCDDAVEAIGRERTIQRILGRIMTTSFRAPWTKRLSGSDRSRKSVS